MYIKCKDKSIWVWRGGGVIVDPRPATSNVSESYGLHIVVIAFVKEVWKNISTSVQGFDNTWLLFDVLYSQK